MHLFAIILLPLSSRYKGIILCFKYYFRLSPHLRDYMVYAMTIFLTWMVGRAGVEPAQPQAGDLQSLGLTTCSVSPYLVGVAGFEPATFCVLNRCSPIWAKHLQCGGADKNRTCYPLRAREMLYQMSYSPKIEKPISVLIQYTLIGHFCQVGEKLLYCCH